MKRHRPGFTLIELLVVMGVIIILASLTVGIQRYVYSMQSTAKARADLHAIATALETYKMKYGDYPWLGSANDSKISGGLASDTSGDLYLVLTGQKVFVRDGVDEAGKPKWKMGNNSGTQVPFLAPKLLSVTEVNGVSYIVDPWGNPYKYSYKSGSKDTSWQSAGFTLISMGPDGKVTDSLFNRVKVGDMPTESEFRAETEALKDKTPDTWPSFDDVVYGMQ